MSDLAISDLASTDLDKSRRRRAAGAAIPTAQNQTPQTINFPLKPTRSPGVRDAAGSEAHVLATLPRDREAASVNAMKPGFSASERHSGLTGLYAKRGGAAA
jgi:hypothetical protein